MKILAIMALMEKSLHGKPSCIFGTRVGTPNVSWVTPNVVEQMIVGAERRTPNVCLDPQTLIFRVCHYIKNIMAPTLASLSASPTPEKP